MEPVALLLIVVVTDGESNSNPYGEQLVTDGASG